MKNQPRQERSRRAVQRIMMAANDEFAEHGFHAAQITRIAQRADVSVGSLYRFFPDKEAIATAITDDYLAAVGDGYGPVLDGIVDQQSAMLAVRQLITIAAELQRTHAGYYRLTNDVRPDDSSWPGHRVRVALVDQFTTTLRRIGVDAEGPSSLEQLLDFTIEVVRRTLADTPAEPDARQRYLAELDSMISSYLAVRLSFVPVLA